MDLSAISSLFTQKAAKPLKVVALPSNLFTVVHFPGGFEVRSVDGIHLTHGVEFGISHELQKDVFLCVDQAISSVISLAPALNATLTLNGVKQAAQGAIQMIVITDEANATLTPNLQQQTFVPCSILVGIILLGLHKLNIPIRLRLNSFLSNLMTLAVKNYPMVGKLISGGPSSTAMTPPQGKLESSRFHELGITVEEFEEFQKAKYLDCYRTMRGLVPPNVTKTSLKSMIGLGIPQEIAERIWNKKILWFICMHPEDLPKIHIGDLRARYNFHGLDVTEMRAVWHCLPPNWQGDNPKAEWKRDFKRKLDALSAAEITGEIDPDDLRNPVYEGYEGLRLFDPDLELNKQDTKNQESEDNQRTHIEEVDPVKRMLLSQWSSDTFDDVDNNDRRVAVTQRVPTMSSLVEGSEDDHSDDESDSFVGHDRVQHLDRSVSSLLNYGESTGSPNGNLSPRQAQRDARKQAKRDLQRRRSLEALDTNISSDDESARRVLKSSSIGSDVSINSNLDQLTPLKTPKRKKSPLDLSNSSDKSLGEQQVRNELDLDKFRSQRQRPTKRLSFHATPKSVKTPKGFGTSPGDADNTGRSSDYASWHDFKSNDSFYSASPAVVIEDNHGSSAGSDYDSSPRNIVKATLAFDVDESNEFPLQSKDVGAYSDGAGFGSAEDTDAEAFGMDDDDDDINHIKSKATQRRRFSMRRPHFLIEDLHFPQTISLADSISAAAVALMSVQSQNQVKSNVGNSSNFSPGLESIIPSLLPDAFKSFAASASTVSFTGRNKFVDRNIPADTYTARRRALNLKDRYIRDKKGIGRYRFFTAAPGGSHAPVDSDSDNEPTEEVVGALYDFDDGDDAQTLTTAEERGFGLQLSDIDNKLVAEDFRDNASMDDSVLDSDFDSVNNQFDDTSLASSRIVSEDSIDYLEPQNLTKEPGRKRASSGPEVEQNGSGRLSWKSYWANFRSRKYNFLSLDEEEEDRQIENEIDNFIVPDELYSDKLGSQVETPGYVFIESPHRAARKKIVEPVCDVQRPENRSLGLRRSFSDMDGLIESSGISNRGHALATLQDENDEFDFIPTTNTHGDTIDHHKRVDDILPENILDFIETFRPFTATNLSQSRISPTPGVRKNAISRASISPIPIGTKIRSRGIEYSTDDWDPHSHSHGTNTAPDAVVDLESEMTEEAHSALERLDTGRTSIEEVVDLTPVSLDEITNIMMFGDPRVARKIVEQKRIHIDAAQATDILLRCVEEIDTISEPLELFMLLVDTLGADPNVRDSLGNCPLHYLFSKPLLGRFIVSRGGDILARDSSGDSVLQLCLDYGYDWVVPAVLSTGREAAILEDRARAKEYSLCLLSLGGYGVKVREFIEDGIVSISADEALDILEKCKGNFESMKDPVETFELLESIILSS